MENNTVITIEKDRLIKAVILLMAAVAAPEGFDRKMLDDGYEALKKEDKMEQMMEDFAADFDDYKDEDEETEEEFDQEILEATIEDKVNE